MVSHFGAVAPKAFVVIVLSVSGELLERRLLAPPRERRLENFEVLDLLMLELVHPRIIGCTMGSTSSLAAV